MSLQKIKVNEIYEEHVDRIYRFFFFKLQDKEVAQDLTSDTFLQFVRQVAKKDMDDPVKYLYGIAKLVFLKHLKRKYKDKIFMRLDVSEFGQYVKQFNEDVEEHETLEEFAKPFIKKLPERQRTVATMRFIEKLELKEIAKKLGKDMNYVKTTQKRAIKSLKKMIACTP